ncbi:hypothetical protein JD844_033912 [Phrynosoma platyrhinos]|uniref:SURP motif domain-containing protein n=1 Tax=Phrynosoma platyrhinos TaxID=52577 RepID=A0ABQ7T7S2_PHRPL|nr:hypothetical protein JD844_033912 [Phrynosoma platyrhinos]
MKKPFVLLKDPVCLLFSLSLPDQELRNVIDKLAQFVARNGPEFEKMTMEKQKENPKFSFLFGGDFYGYYNVVQAKSRHGGGCPPDPSAATATPGSDSYSGLCGSGDPFCGGTHPAEPVEPAAAGAAPLGP